MVEVAEASSSGVSCGEIGACGVVAPIVGASNSWGRSALGEGSSPSSTGLGLSSRSFGDSLLETSSTCIGSKTVTSAETVGNVLTIDDEEGEGLVMALMLGENVAA